MRARVAKNGQANREIDIMADTFAKGSKSGEETGDDTGATLAEVGSSNAVWADQRARPSFDESNTLNTSASSRRMRGSQNQRCAGL